MCCYSVEDLEVFAPSDNLSHKYSRWKLKISHNLLIFFPVRFLAFLFLEEVKLRDRRKTGDWRGGEGRGRKARKRKGEEVPFPLSLIPSTFSFLPLPFQSLSRRFEEVAWHERSVAPVNAWSISNR